MFSRCIILVATCLILTSIAQIPLVSPVAVPTANALPTHKCVKPEYPGRLASINQTKTFNADVKKHLDCLQAFAQAEAELVKAHMAAGNVVIKEYNDYVIELNKLKEESSR
jgi:hypothetical protein